MKSLCWWVISCVSAMAVPVCRLLQPLFVMPLRFGRLVRLRATCLGTVPPTTQFDGPVQASVRAQLVMGEHCRLGRGVFFETNGAGRIEIGAHVRINAGCIIVAYNLVSIADDCLIGEYVSIRDANHGAELEMPMRIQPHSTAPIRIGKDVWIGRGVAVLPGVTVGDGAVIGANSVVNRDVPAGMIAAGIPARVIRSRGSSQQPGKTV